MDATLHALAGLLIKSIPTIFFFIVLTVYLRAVYFRPVGRILEERHAATEGTRDVARRAFEEAGKKTSEYEQALRIARGDIHREHEALRQKWRDEQAAAIARAREQADREIEQARRNIDAEAQQAEAELNAQVDALGDRIAETVLTRRAA